MFELVRPDLAGHIAAAVVLEGGAVVLDIAALVLDITASCS